jgi:hypothetical protein
MLLRTFASCGNVSWMITAFATVASQSRSPVGLRSSRTSLLQVILTGQSSWRGNTGGTCPFTTFMWHLGMYQESPMVHRHGLIKVTSASFVSPHRIQSSVQYTFIKNTTPLSFSDNTSCGMFTTYRRQHGCNCQPKISADE